MWVDGSGPLPLDRVPIREPLGCGIRALDAFVTCGRGQRIGIFGGSGVGKSTLLGMMARGTGADMTVLALVGERGREVGEFLEVIGEEGRKRCVVVVSTSDQSPLLRLRAASAATAIAEYFASAGKNVLLVVDSLTRFAMAQREIGFSAGEPPTAKGYTPSVLNMLARLVERAGCFKSGSITAFYTVLMEGDDQQDPVADTVRSLLDGHVILDRNLAMRNHYPPISMLESLSRLMPNVASEEHMQKAKALRLLLASYNRSEDLIRIGAYQKGADPTLDRAVEILPQLNSFPAAASRIRSSPFRQLSNLFLSSRADMAFQFSLATVLRVRRIIEEREEGILQKILFDISNIFDDLERNDAELAESDASRHADVFQSCIGLQVHDSYGKVRQIKERRKDLERQIEKLEQARDEQLIVYEAARRDREMLTDMREKKRTAYDTDVSKREQNTLDDNYIARRGRY